MVGYARGWGIEKSTKELKRNKSRKEENKC
jgi:hypothetical protein